MRCQIDTKYLVDFFRHIVSVPSPSEFYVRLNPVLKQYAEELGCEMTFDRRNNAYVTLEGEDNSKTVLFTAHADTVGLVVRCIDGNGALRIRHIGGINLATLDGETVEKEEFTIEVCPGAIRFVVPAEPTDAKAAEQPIAAQPV